MAKDYTAIETINIPDLCTYKVGEVVNGRRVIRITEIENRGGPMWILWDEEDTPMQDICPGNCAYEIFYKAPVGFGVVDGGKVRMIRNPALWPGEGPDDKKSCTLAWLSEREVNILMSRVGKLHGLAPTDALEYIGAAQPIVDAMRPEPKDKEQAQEMILKAVETLVLEAGDGG